MAVFRVEKTRDYTVMANHHLKNRSLTLKAKGLLSLMLSLPEDWDYTLKGLSFISRENVDAIREGVKELERAGYIVRCRSRNDKGQLKGAEYVIYEQPQQSAPPILEMPALEKPMLENPILDNPTQENPTLDLPTQENPTQLNTKREKTYPSNTHSVNIHSVIPQPSPAGRNDRPNIEQMRQDIREQIDYEYISTPANGRQIDELVEIMLEVAVTQSDTIKIGADGVFPAEFVKERFCRITSSDIEKLLDGIDENRTRVWNTKAYLLSALFNQPATTDNSYTMRVRSDGAV